MRSWWERPCFVAVVLLAMTVPLLYPPVPPLVDLLGHLGRFRVELDLGRSASLRQFYDFHWAMIGNLGVDLLVVPLSNLFGLELCVKLIVLAIPPLTAASFLWVASEVHGRVPPTAFFALPFIYGFPFLFGFVNFTLAVALAFSGLALWLRLGRLSHTKLRGWLFAPFALLVFFCHVYGWALLGLMCFCASAVQKHDEGLSWPRAATRAMLLTSVMLLPLLVMVIWHGQTQAGSTDHWFDFSAKVQWILSALRDRWKWLDIFSVVVALVVVVEARRSSAVTFSRKLVLPAVVATIIFLALPLVITGSAYADARFVPYIMALALLAIRFPDGSAASTKIAILGLSFLALRLASTTASLAIASNEQQARLSALDSIPHGARVATLVGTPCGFEWALMRNSHLGSMVIVRREGFSNDQWLIPGINLLSLRYDAARLFAADPSELVHANGCRQTTAAWSLDEALRALPPGAFDYLWLIDPPPFDGSLVARMQPVWRGSGAVLYRVSQRP